MRNNNIPLFNLLGSKEKERVVSMGKGKGKKKERNREEKREWRREILNFWDEMRGEKKKEV